VEFKLYKCPVYCLLIVTWFTVSLLSKLYGFFHTVFGAAQHRTAPHAHGDACRNGSGVKEHFFPSHTDPSQSQH